MLALALPSSRAGAQGRDPGGGVIFARERILVLVERDAVTVEGTYVLRNTSPRSRMQSLFYPFPVDSTHPYPDSMSVRQGGRNVPYRRTAGGVSFAVEIPARDVAGFRVSYRQTSLDASACYILTSTAAWGRPLESADFEIAVAPGLALEEVSYDVSEVVRADTDRDGTRRYRMSREDFMPDRDLCLRWRPVGATGRAP